VHPFTEVGVRMKWSVALQQEYTFFLLRQISLTVPEAWI
jgi:hypothetical protein